MRRATTSAFGRILRHPSKSRPLPGLPVQFVIPMRQPRSGPAERSPEKAGGGGSIPSLATIKSIT